MTARILQQMEKRLSEAHDIRELQGISYAIETLMVQENADWHVTIGVHILEPT